MTNTMTNERNFKNAADAWLWARHQDDRLALAAIIADDDSERVVDRLLDWSAQLVYDAIAATIGKAT